MPSAGSDPDQQPIVRSSQRNNGARHLALPAPRTFAEYHHETDDHAFDGDAARFLPAGSSARTNGKGLGWNVDDSNVNVRVDGTRTDVFGTNGKGTIIFDSAGHYASVTLNADIPKFASGNRNTGTAEENKAVVQGSLAHFGTYTVADKVITLKVEGSTWPAWAGTEQKRTIVSFTGDEIKWTLPASIGGTGEVGWKRVK